MTLEITILGCGSSAGVPRVAQGWGACDPNNPKNRRRRCALLVDKPGPEKPTRLLVDAGPDVREQLIAHDVDGLDALLLTHPHADHIHGLDDVRPLTMQMRRLIDCYLDAPTWETVGSRFAYLFKTPPGSAYPPLLIPRFIAHGEGFAPEGPAGPMRGDCRSGSTTATSTRSASASKTSPIRRMSKSSRRRVLNSCKTSTSGSSTPCAIARIPPISA